MEKLTSYCGLVCSDCPAYIATQSGDTGKLDDLARSWSSDSLAFARHEILCDGCRAGGERLFKWCNECTIRACCMRKGFDNCAYCVEFPCAEIDKAPPETKETLSQMKRSMDA